MMMMMMISVYKNIFPCVIY